jgi:hypothetical protein
VIKVFWGNDTLVVRGGTKCDTYVIRDVSIIVNVLKGVAQLGYKMIGAS